MPYLVNSEKRQSQPRRASRRAANPLPVQSIKDRLRYDPETGELFWKTGHCSRACFGTRAGYIDSKGHRIVGIDGGYYRASRIAWLLHHGKEPQHEIDHINRVRDDDRIDNLRDVTHAENMRNTCLTSEA